ncbi:hypothetical protein OS175_13285 [Marinicella sp. S1101]|uniref:McrB family protein n=1 Tax=Marinicella marina TaxID=2996016 RepID=UPI0022608BD3|nr:AAA family ATPase [Marinicella marina]MCX7554847.1 hypothetical protein [Marinicella marina]MDJ1141505.1 hypothetical protein [Marinicella marina]
MTFKKLADIEITENIVSETNLKDFKLPNNLKKRLSDALTDKNIVIGKYTSYSYHQSSSNFALIPNQYFLYASIVYPLALELIKYFNKFDEVRTFSTQLLGSSQKISSEISSDASLKDFFDSQNDIELFSKFMSSEDSSHRLNAKNIIDSNGNPRTSKDCFRSVILKKINLPDATSGILGDLVYYLSKSPDVYRDLYNYYQSTSVVNTSLIEEKKLRDFAKKVFEYFYFDNWKSLIDNSKTKKSSINSVSYVLHSIDSLIGVIGSFSSSQNKASLSTSNTQRFFDSPISQDDNNYYYFSTQWNGKGNYNLTYSGLKTFIENEFPEFEIDEIDNVYYLKKKPQKFKSILFSSHCTDSGLIYSKSILDRFVSSLLTKPFVLLTGLSGSGKTKLAQAFAQWISHDDSQYCIVPVGADWTNREPLLGYVNALDRDVYVVPENGALKLMIEAYNNQDKPYFLILDEMNLSHVERYFADFLSVMESNDLFKLHDKSSDLKPGVPAEIGWSKNLFIIGTVNVDETTYMFSPKVLDRANVIEFKVDETEIEEFLNSPNEVDMSMLKNQGASMGIGFVDLAENKEFDNTSSEKLKSALVELFKELKKVGAEFGYRTGMEINRLFLQLSEINAKLSDEEKIDIAMMQKLLPKLHGSRRKLCSVLESLAKLCVSSEISDNVKEDFLNNEGPNFSGSSKVIYPLSLEKITRMYKGAVDNGFTSYAEA